MAGLTNAEIAAALEEIADILDFQGANPFRVRAYRNAARTVGEMTESVADLVESGERDLSSLPGIGKDLAEKIATLAQTGTLPLLEELRSQVPEGVLQILRIPGLGPKRAAALYRELGVTNLDELRQACLEHRVRTLKGFGEKTEAAILEGLELAAQAAQRMYWAVADQIAQSIRQHMEGCKGIRQMEFAGSYRRGKETVGDLDLLVVADNPASVMDHFGRFSGVEKILARGDTKMSVRLQLGLQVDLRAVPEESFGAALQYFTGSKDHNIVLRGRAKDLGLKVNEYGVFRGEKRIAGRTEEEVYAALGLAWIPPELREAREEFAWAEAGTLPKLVEISDIQGDLHVHSDWTDGTASIEEMALAAKARGLSYIAITDHSKRVSMVGGLDADRLRKQWEEIDRLNRRLKGIRILKGVEVDILEEGGLDLPDDVLAEADWVVASVHYGQNQSREKITRRVLEALENPHVACFAHPTGRLIGKRKPYQIDLEAVIHKAAALGKMLELNAHPQRLDLDDVACASAKKHGVLVVIATDAHSVDGLDAMRYGVLQARRGGLTKADVANARPWSELAKLLRRKK
ncbi:MAG: DNA polymerase/3'-5' exonuclease PolX [Thermoguttaceae bacterium]|nr:DNA polymerase/3'-5' exonuclease PolX [Thermoguttaceae bacterium]MDW8077582.1 DNA polymerase/3'-5' exonuclease PolX [Thermoguttaceae bacterium]